MTLIEARDVGVRLGGTEVLAGVSLDLAEGEVVGLIGPNGAGKTTLLRVLAGLLPGFSGDIRFDGRPLSRIDRRDLARRLAYLAQGSETHWPVSVETLVMLGRFPHTGPWRGPSAADRDAAARAIAACDVAHLAGRPVTRLSAGEKARVLLARALAVEPRVFLADEPVAGLDPAYQLDVMGLIRRLAGDGAGVLVVMHDLTLAARFCDRLALLHDRRIAAHGPPRDVLSPANLARCYGIRAHFGSFDGEVFVVPAERA